MNSSPTLPILSVVVPVFNESANIGPLVDEIVAALTAYEPVGTAFEIVMVDDGSADNTASLIEKKHADGAPVRLVRHPQRLGMSAAIRSGVRAARSDWILTMDGDRQNDPADAPHLCALAWQGGRQQRVLVAGIRVRRQDTLAKRWASRVANFVRRGLLGDDCPDTGCSLKLFPKASYLELPFFNGLHRFMPALLKHYGHACVFVPVNDRPRCYGQSKSDFLGRAVLGAWDLLGVLWLLRRSPPG